MAFHKPHQSRPAPRARAPAPRSKTRTATWGTLLSGWRRAPQPPALAVSMLLEEAKRARAEQLW
eukprot:5567654-Prymnesium_polylepis.3